MLNNKQFSAKLSGVVKSAKSQRDTIQVLIESGLSQYQQHGDTNQLSRIVAACVGVRSLPTTVIKEYIKASANVIYTKAKDGTMVFKKAGGEKEPVVQKVFNTGQPEPTTWYDWEGNTQATPKADFDLMARLKTLQANAIKALENGTVKKGQANKTEEFINACSALIAAES
jgi:hypothetical protein